ncbi:COMM domain-containing protein 3 [Megalops cyprinoides]|uniref:COMM domain-containing protein 3 n=1 Tax=Megalops cyprinoides TaxID=118141 RepID=UPI001863AAD5|nr:COMM domain-containing protein 3 [Megalops cyprinoides]
MEFSESVLKGLQYLADPEHIDVKAFSTLVDVAFGSLLASHTDEAILDGPELKHIDQTLLKHCHVAATTCILEIAKQNTDKSTICSCLEDIKFDAERIDIFYTSYQKNKRELGNLLSGIGRCPPRVCEASWRLDYQIKNSHMHKVNQPAYLITLNVENVGARSTDDVQFSCTMEQLQDLLGKLKDAAKSLDKATQM